MKLRFVSKQHETGNIWSFFFEPLDRFEWVPGQYFNLTMPDVPPVFADRLFTISSAPHEEYVRVTTFIGESPFKQKLKSLEPGAEVEADQIGGDFTWDAIPVIPAQAGIQKKRLFIAGGLGITPFRSIIVDRFHNHLPQHVVLLWSGRDGQCPFDDELTDIAARSSDISIHRYEVRLTSEKITQEVPDIKERIVYLAGSQAFVETLGEGLMALGIPRSQIKYDWFDGYTGTLV